MKHETVTLILPATAYIFEASSSCSPSPLEVPYRHAAMGIASSLAMTKNCLGPEVAPVVVKLLAGGTQGTIEVKHEISPCAL